MKGVQCYELFGGIALKIHTFSFFIFSVKDKILQPSVYCTSTILNELSRDVVWTFCFVVFETENGLFHFVEGWWVIKFWDDRHCR